MPARHTVLLLMVTASCAVGADLDGDAEVDAATKPDMTLSFDLVQSRDLIAGDTLDDVTDDRASDATVADDFSAPADDRPAGPCGRATSCGACTGFGGCGWCGGTNICVPGGPAGPTDGRCVTGWAYTSVICVNPTDTCEDLSGCGACLARSGCGWCGAANRCLTANAARNGPATGTCSAMWAGEAAACNVGVDPCTSRTDCGACTTTPGCGWCRSSLSCMSGTPTGPATGRTCASWAGARSSCRNPSDSCNSSGNCATCTVRSDCGWCDDSDTCHSGSSSGPTSRACAPSNWGWRSVISCL